MNKLKTLLAAVSFTALTATAASAVVIDFGNQGTVEPGSASIDVSGGGYTVTASSVGVDGGGNTVAALTTRTGSPINGPNQGGLGVKSPNDSNQSIDGGIGANSIYKDILYLTFTHAVKIVSISFSLVDVDKFGHHDTAFFTVDGVNMGNFDVSSSAWPTFMATGGWVGTKFGFGAPGQLDDYKLRAIEVTPVPVPPALLLFATGVAGIGALSRRNRR